MIFILLSSTIPRFLLFAEGVKAKVFIRAKPFLVEGRRYLRLQQLKMDFSVQNIKMGVENVRDTNSILCKLQFFLYNSHIVSENRIKILTILIIQ